MCHSLYEMQPSLHLREAEERLRVSRATGARSASAPLKARFGKLVEAFKRPMFHPEFQLNRQNIDSIE